jgi:hypothetical protein
MKDVLLVIFLLQNSKIPKKKKMTDHVMLMVCCFYKTRDSKNFIFSYIIS